MKKNVLRTVILAIACLLTSNAFATPSVSSVSGNFTKGQTVTISGSGFGAKSPAKPYLWAPFDGSLDPSNLGIVTSWKFNESMGYNSSEGVNGAGCAKAADSSGTWTLGVESSGFNWNDYNQEIYIFRKIKINFDVSGINWKTWRMWNNDYSYPDIYIQSGSNKMLDVEGIQAYAWFTNPAQGAPGSYHTEEIICKGNSNSSSDDTNISFNLDGSQIFQFPTGGYSLQTKNDSRPMTMNFPVHGVKANAELSGDSRYWADDVYLDTTWARVMIGSASSWSACNQKEPQIPSAWSNGSITVTVNQGAFATNQKVYLYVVDSTGAVNSSGYPITIGTGLTAGNLSAPHLNQPTVN
jgi:hypothetical protein